MKAAMDRRHFSHSLLASALVATGLLAGCSDVPDTIKIGVAQPLSVYVDTHGTGQADEARIAKVLRELFDLSPKGIRTHLQLNRPIYATTAAYGHFGREPGPDGTFTWEKTDLVDELKRLIN